MKRRWKILGGVACLSLAGLAALALALSHDAACPAPPAPATGVPTMQGWMARCYGSPDVLAFETLPLPVLPDDRVLVRVHAAAGNPLDWHGMRGEPRIMRLSSGFGAPEDPRFGTDFAGVVAAVGASVAGFAVGDRVFGVAPGAFAQHAVVNPARMAKIPDGVDFAQAAAVPVAAVTALQALRDHGRLRPGQRVLVNGASGGVGTFAVQIAKAMGAEVSAVCSTRNVDLVRSLGADRVFDYTREDFTASGERWDLVVDTVSNHGVFALARAIADDGALVVVGSNDDEVFLGPLRRFLAALVADPFVAPRLEGMLAEVRAADLEHLAGLMRDGRLRSAIDRTFPLAEADEAIRYLETGRARGKVVVAGP
jgi:NADPH:quinone reductase-like Zn-dependent oxidoreductase